MPTGLFTLTQVNQAVRQGAWTGFIAPTWVEYLVVAGGGGAGRTANGAGGGGGGGLLTGIVTVLANTSYTVTVGAGGAGSTSASAAGSSGAASVLGVVSAAGGGGGASGSTASTFANATSGGSGGGGTGGSSGSGTAGAQGTANQGNAGGNGSGNFGGGGGGAGTQGLNSPNTIAGNGGAGIASAISGAVVAYGGGGAGGINATGSGTGGVGGGGSTGLTSDSTGVSGGGNTGGGGGGGWGSGANQNGGAGGSGVVIIRYPGTVQYFTGGTLSYANGYVIHTFNASGTFAPTTPTPYIVEDYQISRSLRFNSADSAYLNRTFPSAGNRRTWTYSTWVKRVNSGTTQHLLRTNATPITLLRFEAADQLYLYSVGVSAELRTTAVYRDFSAWYHVVWTIDTTQATASDRLKLYVNGVQVTSFTTATYPSQNTELGINTASAHAIGASPTVPDEFANQYLTEINFIDGQALTPSSFGYYNFNTGVWSPTKYVGVYGTNGFYLNFSDNSNTTAATLGADYSGNGNNWTPNNFSVSAGAGNDSLVDVPTNWGVDTGVGGEVRGNYCTLNPLIARWDINTAAITNGNLDAADTVGDANNPYVFGTLSVNSGKFYWEITVTAIGTSAASFSIGVDSGRTQSTTFTDWVSYAGDGNRYAGSTTPSAYGATYTTGDVIGVALDKDAGTVTFYKNNASQGAISLPTNVPMVAWLSPGANSGSATANFGQRPFAYTAPSGFKALNTQNLPTPTIGATPATQAGEFFAPVTYTGNGTTQTITVGFQPDFVWIKNRANSSDHGLFDVLRGVTRRLESNTTAVENTISGLTAFTADGFTIGSDYNNNNLALMSWNWKANGAGVTNTAGSITSTVSANTTSGFSVVTFTSQASGTATVGHGLGAAPKMVIVKGRNVAYEWYTYHASLGASAYISLSNTAASAVSATFWNATSPTSSVFSLGAPWAGSHTFVAYCFAEVPGYSRFGSYTGNGSADGPFVFCGFRPAYVMIKRADATGNWILKDTTRAPYNADGNTLIADLPDAEYGPSNTLIDELSNGFKCRDTSASINFSGNTYIFMAFASAPQKFALAR